MQKLAIIGSRSLAASYEEHVLAWLQAHVEIDSVTTIVSGGAIGADAMAERIAQRLEKKMLVFAPDYRQFKRQAPVIRNSEIARTADLCLALVDKPLEASKGTYDCVKKFRTHCKPIFILELGSRV